MNVGRVAGVNLSPNFQGGLNLVGGAAKYRGDYNFPEFQTSINKFLAGVEKAVKKKGAAQDLQFNLSAPMPVQVHKPLNVKFTQDAQGNSIVRYLNNQGQWEQLEQVARGTDLASLNRGSNGLFSNLRRPNGQPFDISSKEVFEGTPKLNIISDLKMVKSIDVPFDAAYKPIEGVSNVFGAKSIKETKLALVKALKEIGLFPKKDKATLALKETSVSKADFAAMDAVAVDAAKVTNPKKHATNLVNPGNLYPPPSTSGQQWPPYASRLMQ